MEKLLQKNLYRADCPDPVELGDYQLSTLPEPRSASIRLHLDHCPHCRLELKQLASFLSETAPDIEYSLGERLQIWIASLIPNSQPNLAFALRGDEEASLRRYTFGDGDFSGELTVDIQKDPHNPGRQILLGMLTGIPFANLRAGLWQSGAAVADTLVEEFGNLSFARLSPGLYDLILTSPEFEIHVQGIQV